MNSRVEVVPVDALERLPAGGAAALIHVRLAQQSGEARRARARERVQLRLVAVAAVQTRVSGALVNVDVAVPPRDP